ncbi:NAD(P)H-quinone oxidoreductase [Paenibacillus nanensis]|uniref:NAD(P)H-quinone oxidoreductase n=1 Tax=Paenibacillus nanensis TaxID=393251 RepID=UPI001F0CA45A|nr:NAD(P)H-quinone oxidoreductase [Paenibacillus nanensis]
MKAVLQHLESKALYIGETDEPKLADGELLVRVKATALNRADLLQKRGQYPPPPGATAILGLEMAGVVEGPAGPWKKGDRVMALLPGGGYAERVRLPADMAMPIPDRLSFAEAASIPEVFLTAYLNLFKLGGLKAGRTALIHAGASGVGTAAIQLAKAAGCTVIVTAGSPAKREACLRLGADLAVDYREGPFLPAVMAFTENRGVDVILDFVGASYWEQNAASLALDGRLIIVGLLGGANVPDVNLGMLLSRRLQIIGTSLRTLSRERKAALTADFVNEILPRISTGEIRPIIDSEWDWSQVEEAHLYMEQNRNIGKIVMNIT